MASETSGGALGGAAQGAAAGAAFGPWGAVIGAVIGGVVGAFSGEAKRKAKRYGRMAADTRRKQQTMQLAIQRRDVVRQIRLQRAQAVAAGASDEGVTSSAVGGAISSITGQGRSSLTYFDNQVALDNKFQQLAKKAGKYAGKAEDLDALMGSLGSIATTAGNVYGSLNVPSSTTGGNNISFNDTAARSNMSNNSAFTSFGSALDL